MKCEFKNHKSTEKICKNCGYIIERTSNDELTLKTVIEYTSEIPRCSFYL